MAYGQINPFVAARDEMLNVLAQREARAIEAQKRQFEQQRVEQEMALRQQQADDLAGYRADQAESLRVQREGQAAAAKALEDQRGEATRAARAQAEQIAYIVSHPDEFHPNVVQAAQMMQIGVKPTADIQTGRDRMAEIEASSQAALDRTLAAIDARETARDRRAATPKDNPALPTGTKQWIDSLSQRGLSIEDARNELSKGWHQQTAAHPTAELGEASKYLLSLYPPSDADTLRPRVPLGQAEPPQPTASLTTIPYKPDIKAPAGPSDEEIAKMLTDAGKAVTPEAIAVVRKRLTGGK